ncbi:MAG: hypothetical protein HC873_10420 [Leptolyngbyaceae cyanobacterium SL_1_1]|nr:hypothetical protein [Leptolyngbyaceae cyanobacterium SL_1_1]
MQQGIQNSTAHSLKYFPRIDASQLTPEACFELQYNYARCCLLVKRVQQTHSGCLRAAKTSIGQIEPLQLTEYEQNLLHALVEATDSCFSVSLQQPARHCLTHIMALSRHTEQFCRQYSCVQGEVQRLTYLRLLLSVRAVLKHCLVALLGLEAPTGL